MKLDNHNLVHADRADSLEDAMRLRAHSFFERYDRLETALISSDLPNTRDKWANDTRIYLLTTLLTSVHECGTADLALQQASLTEPEIEHDGNASR